MEIKPNCDDYDEDKITRQYMDKYGIDNVRGGSFVSVKLEKSEINVLHKMSNGKDDHFANECQENKCEHHEKYCNSKYKKHKIYKHNNDDDDDDVVCFRCGREGRYASKDVNGYYL